MSELEPPGGLSLDKAFQAYTDPEKLSALEEADIAFSSFGRPRAAIRGTPPARTKRALESAKSLALQDFRGRIMADEFELWGAENDPSASRRRIPRDAKPHLRPSVASGTLEDPKGLRIYAVRVYRANEIEELERGATMSRIAEILYPKSWQELGKTYIPLLVIGDERSESRHSRAMAALNDLSNAFLADLRSGRLELRTIYPPQDPQARWKSVSLDVLQTVSLNPRDFDDSTIELQDGHRMQVRVFYPSTRSQGESTADEALCGPADRDSRQKQKIYARVADAWDSLASAQRENMHRRGRRKEIAELIHATRLPDVAYASVERELRRVLQHCGVETAGTKPGK